LIPILRITARSDAEIRRLLEKTAQAAESDILRLTKSGPGAITRRGQLQLANRTLKKTLANFWRDVGDTIRASKLDAVVATLDATFTWDEPFFIRAGFSAQRRKSMRQSLLEMSERNIERMLRRFSTTQIPLSKQVYRTNSLTNKWVDNLINRAIGRGLSAKELAREVKQFIKPNVRGGVSYAALRLARTEINNASHATAIAQATEKPWALGMQWHLSASHPKRDECDDLAKEDSHDLGAGVFPPDAVPLKPHPQCFCYVTPEVVGEDEFLSHLIAGDYDEFLSTAFD
jgi:hypothetical protein